MNKKFFYFVENSDIMQSLYNLCLTQTIREIVNFFSSSKPDLHAKISFREMHLREKEQKEKHKNFRDNYKRILPAEIYDDLLDVLYSPYHGLIRFVARKNNLDFYKLFLELFPGRVGYLLDRCLKDNNIILVKKIYSNYKRDKKVFGCKERLLRTLVTLGLEIPQNYITTDRYKKYNVRILAEQAVIVGNYHLFTLLDKKYLFCACDLGCGNFSVETEEVYCLKLLQLLRIAKKKETTREDYSKIILYIENVLAKEMQVALIQKEGEVFFANEELNEIYLALEGNF
jgi:hypothetical protein